LEIKEPEEEEDDMDELEDRVTKKGGNWKSKGIIRSLG
jgi:hypothetical protein